MNSSVTYSWKEKDVELLISERIEKNASFVKSKRGMARILWGRIADALNCGATGIQCQKKWQNLLKKYKEIVIPKTGEGLEDDEHEAHTWPHFDSINKFMSDRHTITPAMLLQSSSNNSTGSVEPVPSTSGGQTSQRAVSKRIVDSEASDDEACSLSIQRKRQRRSSTIERTLEMLEKVNEKLDANQEQQDESLANEKILMNYIRIFFEKKN